MKTQLNIRKKAVFQVIALMAMFIAVFANLDSLPVSADTGQIETPSIRDRGRSSPYWVGRGLIIEEPGSPDNHVMILRQKHREDYYSVYTLDPIPVQPGEIYEVSWDSRSIRSCCAITGIVIDTFENDLLIQRMYITPELSDEWQTFTFPNLNPLNATHILVHLLPTAYELDLPENMGVPIYPGSMDAGKSPEGSGLTAAPVAYDTISPTGASDLGRTNSEDYPPNTILFDNLRIQLPGKPGSIVPDWNFENLITPGK